MPVQGRWRQDERRWDEGQPGDWWFGVDNSTPPRYSLIFRCPHCGEIRSVDLSDGAAHRVGTRFYWEWNKNRERPTLKPSIHARDPPPGVPRAQAGPVENWPTHWHGFLTDGVWTP